MIIFGENPFQKLEKGRFPVAGPSPQREEIRDDPELRMFYTALEKLPVERGSKRNSGFLLGEQCALPRLVKPKMKKKKSSPVIHKSEPAPSPEKDKDGQDAFLLAMRNTVPLRGSGRDVVPRVARAGKEAIREPGFEELLGSLDFTLQYSDEYLEGYVCGLDELVMNRLRAGDMSPEAHLDLHGLNAEQAFESLRFFMRDAWFKSLRVVLVVTGRGRNSPSGQGILRRKLQTWLTQEPFKRVVLAFCTARPHDGGPGSIYVLLRKFRKKGRIAWNRLPADADLYHRQS